MESLDKDLMYEKISSPEQIMLATKIELEIFPEFCGYLSYANAEQNGNTYYLVYKQNIPIGITGIYTDDSLSGDEKFTAWLGWYGVIKEYRNKGYGKQILLDTISEAKRRGYKKFRLYTSKVKCKEAINLYDKIMDIGEDYTLEQLYLQRKVYSKSLTDNAIDKWNNRNLFLDDAEKQEQQGLEIYNQLVSQLYK